MSDLPVRFGLGVPGHTPQRQSAVYGSEWACTCGAYLGKGRPAHLEPVTNSENVLRGNTTRPGRAPVTHCGTCGTPYDEVNTYWTPAGRRDCRACRRNRRRKGRAA